MVMEIVHEDIGEGNMQCINHPYRNSSPGGICALCLQEKLGKLVSSSFPSTSSSSSSSSSAAAASPSPSVRSDFNALQIHHHHPASSSSNSQNQANEYNHHKYYTKGSKLPFVLTHKKEKKEPTMRGSDSTSTAFKRSKSTTASRRGMHFLNENYSQDYSPNRRGFWSFLYLSKHSTAKKSDKHYKDFNFGLTTPSSVGSAKKIEDFVVVDENGSPDQTALSRKVSRSRSVGCGSRSFSGEFFERISTGFGDCVLRRVESQREGKPKMQRSNGQNCIKERVKCGGIFSGFMITSSSSLIEGNNVNGSEKEISAVHSSMRHLSHGRSRSWGWALASPMRAFAKQSAGKRESNSRKNATPNLAAIPSLLAVSG